MDPSYDDKFIRRLEEHNVTLKVNKKLALVAFQVRYW